MNTSGQDSTFSGYCHCGEVGFSITEAPERLVDCNCSICRRVGALWGHIDSSHFTRLGDGETIEYVQGDKTLAVHSCKRCGCTTHWTGIDSDSTRMAVNFRMCDPSVITEFRIRRFDGADTWEFLD